MEYCGRLIDVIDEPKCVEVQRGGGGGHLLLQGFSFIVNELSTALNWVL